MGTEEKSDENGSVGEGEASTPKASLRSLILRMANPLSISTEGLGRIQARNPTATMERAFLERQPSVDGVDDFGLVRTYMGCVSGIPETEQEPISEPLSLAQVSQLTDADVKAFAPQYLEHFVKPESVTDPISQMAAHIRAEHARAKDYQASLPEMAKKLMDRMTGTAEIMRNWRSLQQNIASPSEEAKRRLEPFMNTPLFGKSGLSQALENIERDRKTTLDASAPSSPSKIVGADTERMSYNLSQVFVPPAFKETPLGKSVLSMETQLSEIGDRMEDAMGIIVEQVGNVSSVIGNVITTITSESRTFREESERQTQSAVFFAKFSLAVSTAVAILALIVTYVGYKADRNEAQSGDVVNEKTAAALQEENKRLAEIVKQQTELLDVSRKQARSAEQIPSAIQRLDEDLRQASSRRKR